VYGKKEMPEERGRNSTDKSREHTEREPKISVQKCGKAHTPEPKTHGYSEEEKKQAIKCYYEGNSGRSVGIYFKMSKANAVRWIKERAEEETKKQETPNEAIVCETEEMDEMYIHIGSKKRNLCDNIRRTGNTADSGVQGK
jgi:transposase-like protein